MIDRKLIEDEMLTNFMLFTGMDIQDLDEPTQKLFRALITITVHKTAYLQEQIDTLNNLLPPELLPNGESK